MNNSLYHPPKLSKGPLLSYLGALGLAALIFLTLPFTQLLSGLKKTKTLEVVQAITIPSPTAPPTAPPTEDEPKVEEEKKLKLQQEAHLLNLSQLEAALYAGVGDALNLGEAIIGFGVIPDTIAEIEIFELKDLDTKPRRIFTVNPVYPFQFKREGIEGKVGLVIVIDEAGRVIDARTEYSTHREFIKPSIEAVLQWRFEPGKKNGKPVKARYRLPMSFVIKR